MRVLRAQIINAGEPNEVTTLLASVTAANLPPVLRVEQVGTATERSPVTLKLSATDKGTDTVSRWIVAWGDGEVSEIAGATAEVSHLFVSDGQKAVQITAVDEDGSTTTSASISVANAAPELSGLGVTAAIEGSPVRLTGAVSDAPTDTVSLDIDWGDGSAVERLTLAAGQATFAFEHVFAQDGAYTISVTPRDAENAVGAAGTITAAIINGARRSPASARSAAVLPLPPVARRWCRTSPPRN